MSGLGRCRWPDNGSWRRTDGRLRMNKWSEEEENLITQSVGKGETRMEMLEESGLENLEGTQTPSARRTIRCTVAGNALASLLLP